MMLQSHSVLLSIVGAFQSQSHLIRPFVHSVSTRKLKLYAPVDIIRGTRIKYTFSTGGNTVYQITHHLLEILCLVCPAGDEWIQWWIDGGGVQLIHSKSTFKGFVSYIKCNKSFSCPRATKGTRRHMYVANRILETS